MSSTRGDDILYHGHLIVSQSTTISYSEALEWAIDFYASTVYST